MLLILVAIVVIFLTVISAKFLTGLLRLVFNVVLWGIGLVVAYILIKSVYGAFFPFIMG